MVQAQLVSSFTLRLVVVGVLTFGIGALVLWWVSRGYVATLDEQGVTTRGGARHAWSDLTQVRPRYLRRLGRAHLNDVGLVFRTGTAGVFPAVIENADEVLALVRRVTKQPIPLTS